MALARRTGQRFQASIWPGYVDAITGLLLVLMFVLTIFMVVQALLRDTITGQESELNVLATEVASLAQSLGLESEKSARLQAQLNLSQDEITQQNTLIATLRATQAATQSALEGAEAKITDFESQVAALLAQGKKDQAQIAALEGEKARVTDEAEAARLALAQVRAQVDAQAEAARLAAAKREALEALIASLQTEQQKQNDMLLVTQEAFNAAKEDLSETQKAKLAEAAAAEALRKRLQDADAELTAMSLALEDKRREAEETLTLLAAARSAKAELEGDLTEAEKKALLLAQARAQLSKQKEISLKAQLQVEALNQQIAQLRSQLTGIEQLLDQSEAKEAEAQVQIDALGTRLNAALARVAVEERKRRTLEEAERLRLEEERNLLAQKAKDLESYKSEFFGRLRQLLQTRDGVRIEGDRFVFSSEVLFSAGKAELAEDGKAQIAKVATLLREIAAQIPDDIDWIIRVDGHTDNSPLSGQGDYADNWELSTARALSVVKYMTETQNIPPARLSANGFGEFQPIDTANTAQARAKNRRIELKLTER